MLKEGPGWNLTQGVIVRNNVSEDEYWSLFNFVFSDGSRKRNTYKFGLIKSLLDNLFNASLTGKGIYLSYDTIFASFAQNYWNLVVKYNLKQMRKDGRTEISKIEQIFYSAVYENNVLMNLEFDSIDEELRKTIVKDVTKSCKRNVVGALYKDFDGCLYSFNLHDTGIYIAPNAYSFMMKYKFEIEKINYYSWAKLLEKLNDDSKLIGVIDKLELSTPRRSDLSIYRQILKEEFETSNCFYCGKKLINKSHVDHFIPWSFVKNDKIWNFVLACPECNEKKNNKLPIESKLNAIEIRNQKLMLSSNPIIVEDFNCYTEDLLRRIWTYAKFSGLKEYSVR